MRLFAVNHLLFTEVSKVRSFLSEFVLSAKLISNKKLDSQMRAQINCKIDPFTISGSRDRVPYFGLSCPPNYALPYQVFRGARNSKCHVDVSQRKM